MMSIGWAPKDCQADVAHVYIQAVFAIVKQAAPVRNFAITRDTRDIYPRLTWFFLPVGEAFRVTVWNLMSDLHELDIDRKAELEHLELFVPIHHHADIDLFPVRIHGEILNQLG